MALEDAKRPNVFEVIRVQHIVHKISDGQQAVAERHWQEYMYDIM